MKRMRHFPALALLMLVYASMATAGPVPGSGTGAGSGDGKRRQAEISSAPDAQTLRLSSVKSPADGGLYDALLPAFQKSSGYRVVVTLGEDVYGPARRGEADLVLSHFGHHDARVFVQEGYGEWPRAVFANQTALIGPAADPAGIRGMTDAAAAMRRIAETRSRYIVNEQDGLRYLTEILWHSAGSPDRAGWYVEGGLAKREALEAAAAQDAYVLWGLTPFLRTQREAALALEPMVLADPLLQRVMVTVIVSPGKVPGVNHAGAVALQSFLLAPATQARIRSFRLPGIDTQVWWPAGRHNAAER